VDVKEKFFLQTGDSRTRDVRRKSLPPRSPFAEKEKKRRWRRGKEVELMRQTRKSDKRQRKKEKRTSNQETQG